MATENQNTPFVLEQRDFSSNTIINYTCSVNIGTGAGPSFYFNDPTAAPNATDSIGVGTRQLIAQTGNLSKLYVALTTAPGGVTTRTFTVYKNGVATTLACTITGAATTGSNIATTVAISAGDTVSIAQTNVGPPANSDGAIISFTAGM